MKSTDFAVYQVTRTIARLNSASWLGAESDHGNDSEQDGEHEDDELRQFEWRFGLGRSDCLQRRDFFEGLHDQHEQIEVETDHCADHVDRVPCSGEMPGIAGENG